MKRGSVVFRSIVVVAVALAAALALEPAAHAERGGRSLLTGVKRIVFLGDSITYSGQYIEYLETFLRTRMPDADFELINLGLPSETVSGLTEPNHAGGAFPRPCLHERLDRALAKTHPDLVVACYGMNDGIYYPFSEERFQRYQEGIRRLVDRVHAVGAKLLLLTPPTFDPNPILKSTLPAGRDVYPSGSSYVGYDEVLERYSHWLLDQRKHGWNVADVHGPMLRHLQARRRKTPEYRLAGDGVHTNSFGHWLIAEAVLRAWGFPTGTDAETVDVHRHVVDRDAIRDFSGGDAISFTWLVHRPLPLDPGWDPEAMTDEQIVEHWHRYRLKIEGMKPGRYLLTLGDQAPVTVTDHQLAQGVAPSLDRETAANQADLPALIHQRQHLLTNAWLTAVGHSRPGMEQGAPLDDALRQAAEMDAKIRPLAAPVPIRISLSPAGAE
jgi:lysophospholipase L1-like esterase